MQSIFYGVILNAEATGLGSVLLFQTLNLIRQNPISVKLLLEVIHIMQ